MINLYDTEVNKIDEVVKTLIARASGQRRNFQDFENEIKDRLAAEGFVASVKWFTAQNPDGTQVEGMFMPEITIEGRIATDGSVLKPEDFTFDHDRQVHEITHDVLGLGDEASSVIKTGSMDPAHRDVLAAHKTHKH